MISNFINIIMKKLALIISVVTIMIMAASCSGGSCQKEALTYLQDSISLMWKDPKSFHFDKPEIMRETDSTFLAKVKIYGNNSYGNEICHDYMYMYMNIKNSGHIHPKGGWVIELNTDTEYEKTTLDELRKAYKKDEELRKINTAAADTTSELDFSIETQLSFYLILKEATNDISAPF